MNMQRSTLSLFCAAVLFAATAGALEFPTELERTDMKALVSEFRLAAALKPEPGVLVQYGTVCEVGKDPADALARVMSALNAPVIKLKTDFSAYTGSRYSGQYLMSPYVVLGQAVSRRISVILERNWLSCLPVQGSSGIATNPLAGKPVEFIAIDVGFRLAR